MTGKMRALPSSSTLFSLQQTGLPSVSLPTPTPSICQCPASFSPHSRTGPQDTWTPPLYGAVAPYWRREGNPPLFWLWTMAFRLRGADPRVALWHARRQTIPVSAGGHCSTKPVENRVICKKAAVESWGELTWYFLFVGCPWKICPRKMMNITGNKGQPRWSPDRINRIELCLWQYREWNVW